jgi:hypothetical protein
VESARRARKVLVAVHNAERRVRREASRRACKMTGLSEVGLEARM